MMRIFSGFWFGFLVEATRIAPEPEPVGQLVNVAALLSLTEADTFTQTIHVKGRQVTTASGYKEIRTDVEVSALPPQGDVVWERMKEIVAGGRAEGRPDHTLTIHRIGDRFEFNSEHVMAEAEKLLVHKQQVCEAGGLKHPLDEREPVVSMSPADKLQQKQSESMGLLKCLSESFSEFTSGDFLFFTNAQQIQTDLTRQTIIEAPHEVDFLLRKCERILHQWLALLVPWYVFTQGDSEMCYYMISEKPFPLVSLSDVLVRFARYQDETPRFSRYADAEIELYHKALGFYWLQVVKKSEIFKSVFPPDSLKDIELESFRTFNLFLLRPCGGYPRFEMEPVWSFVIKHGRPGILAMYLGTLSVALKCMQEYMANGLTDESYNDLWWWNKGHFEWRSESTYFWWIPRWKTDTVTEYNARAVLGAPNVEGLHAPYRPAQVDMDMFAMVANMQIAGKPWDYVFGSWKIGEAVALATQILNHQISNQVSFKSLVRIIDELVDNNIVRSRQAFADLSVRFIDSDIVPSLDSIQLTDCDGSKYVIHPKVTSDALSRMKQQVAKEAVPDTVGDSLAELIRQHNPWTIQVVSHAPIRLEQESYESYQTKLRAAINCVPKDHFLHPNVDLDRVGCLPRRPERIGDNLSREVTSVLECYGEAPPSAPWRSVYWSAVTVRGGALKHVEKFDLKSLSECEEIHMIVNVVILRAHDGLGGGDGMLWCLSLKRVLDTPIGIIEALLVISNKILRSTQFGLHKSERYWTILATHWAELIGLESASIPTIVEKLKQVTLGAVDEPEEFWKDLFRKGRSGVFHRLVVGMERGKLSERANSIPFTSLVSAMDVIIDDITINSIL